MKTLSKILLAASTLLPATVSAAPSVKSFMLHNGNNAGLLWENNNPRNNDQRGAGLEHMSSHVLKAADGGPVVLTIGTGSYTDIPGSPIAPAGTRLQGLCTSFKLDQTAGLQKGAMRYFTANRGNEYQNAMVPGATPIMGGKYLLVTYGVDLNSNTEVYAKVLGPNCEELSPQTRILAKNNDNVAGNADLSLTMLTDGDDKASVGDCVIGNGNGGDNMYCYGMTVTKTGQTGANSFSLAKDFDFVGEQEEERSRSYTAAVPEMPGYMFECAAVGDNQPPDRGLRCGLMNMNPGVAANQRVVWRKYLAERTGNTYYTTPNLAAVKGADGKTAFVVTYVKVVTNGSNNRGTTTFMQQLVRPADTGLEILTPPMADLVPVGDKSHPTMCGGMWGSETDGTPAAFVVTGTITDGGPGNLSILRADPSTGTMSNAGGKGTAVTFSNSTGAGYISQWYGNNPNTPQGRNHQHCTMLDNPGYQVAGGFQPEVQSFLMMSNTGKMAGEDKSYAELVLVPAVVPAAANPVDPEPTNPDPDPVPTPDPDPSSPVGGGCSTGGSSSGGAMIFGLGAALALVRRRRRA
jgi:MYXO-CTERM domain-containing protein